MTTKEQVVVDAVKAAKRSQFGLTAIKVELEIRFHRDNQPRPTYGCSKCTSGEVLHSGCRGVGCIGCSHNGRKACMTCLFKNIDWNNLRLVNDYVLKQLVKFGLAERIPDGERYAHSYFYRPKSPLVFAKTYNDVTVDTELTFTLSVEEPESALLLPKFLKAFYGLKKHLNQEPSVAGAGMHMSLLNSEGGVYPTYSTPSEVAKFRNFRKSMILLMPALFFLGSPDSKSRPMGYRRPMVEQQHYSAINYGSGALEFRVFETCYEYPETILDNVVVMCNCLRFWTKKYTRNHLQKITKECLFGNDGGGELSRLFVTTQHIDLLNRGLRMIKPSYRTITELKTQRNFTITKRAIRSKEVKALKVAEQQYIEYEYKYGWEQVMRKNNYINDFLSDAVIYTSGVRPAPGDPETLRLATERAEEKLKNRTDTKTSKPVFINETINKELNAGDYKLCVV